MTDQFKRNIAFKFNIGELLSGSPIFDGERFSHINLADNKIVRVNIIGNIVDRYDSDGEKQYSFITLDDGSGQIKLKSFGDDVAKFKLIDQGQTVTVIGVLRHFNNETYIAPEIISQQDPKYLLIRKLELEKMRKENPIPVQTQPQTNSGQSYSSAPSTSQPSTKAPSQPAVKEEAIIPATPSNTPRDKLLDAIKAAEEDGGIDVEKLESTFEDITPEQISEETKKLLEEGIVFEPRPGKLRYLG